MKLNPLVSIIMPAINAGKTINESISSVVNQSYNNWELIVVNDGSIDNTSEIVK
jgi:teichuronic acid biosynthesis glycosyltransferase TuaG